MKKKMTDDEMIEYAEKLEKVSEKVQNMAMSRIPNYKELAAFCIINDICFPERLIVYAIEYYYSSKCDNESDQTDKELLEFFDCTFNLDLLDEIPGNIDEYIFKKIEFVYGSKYVNFYRPILNDIAKYVIKEMDIQTFRT